MAVQHLSKKCAGEKHVKPPSFISSFTHLTGIVGRWCFHLCHNKAEMRVELELCLVPVAVLPWAWLSARGPVPSGAGSPLSALPAVAPSSPMGWAGGHGKSHHHRLQCDVRGPRERRVVAGLHMTKPGQEASPPGILLVRSMDQQF